MRTLRIRASLLTVALAAATMTIVGTGTATAAGVANCRVSGTMTFSPPLTDTPQQTTITIDGRMTLCVEATTSLDPVIAGTLSATWQGPASKLSTGTLNASDRIDWELLSGGHDSSRAEGTVTVSAAGVFPFLGQYVHGRFTGNPHEITIEVPQTQLADPQPIHQVVFVDTASF